jgi:very-short-patch-repair endonuclease
MSDDNAFTQALDEHGYVMRSIIPARISDMPTQPESPIERALLIGMMSLSFSSPCYDFGDPFSRATVKLDGDLPTILVELQKPIEGYRADFLLTVRLKENVIGRVVVECDGHAFHERTKEQAARDRSRDRVMTLAGYTVMRFTGSELHRDLMNCVADAHQAAWQFYEKWPKP